MISKPLPVDVIGPIIPTSLYKGIDTLQKDLNIQANITIVNGSPNQANHVTKSQETNNATLSDIPIVVKSPSQNKRNRWTKEEQDTLIKAVTEIKPDNDGDKWLQISKLFNGRTPKNCSMIIDLNN